MKKGLFFKCQQGASAVEFAIVLPLLLLFVFGIIEFGILLYDKAVITNASREGARAAALFRTTIDGTPTYLPQGAPGDSGNTSVYGVVNDYCANHLITFGGTATPSVTVINPSGAAGTAPDEYRTVTVAFGYNFLVLPNILAGFFGGTMSGPIPLNAVTQMRTEYQGGL
jgi:Flp pilus assembly protein TadG